MDMGTSWIPWAAGALIFASAVLAVIGVAALRRPQAVRDRLQQLAVAAADPSQVDASTAEAQGVLWARVARWTAPVRRLAAPRGADARAAGQGVAPPFDGVAISDADAGAVAELRRRLAHAGIRHRQAPAAFFGLKAALALVLPLAGFALLAAGGVPARGASWPATLLALAALGYGAPTAWLGVRARRRQRAVVEAFPDALDLMTVCVEAGLGTEAALVRVARDLELASPALAQELQLVNLELRAGATRDRALRALAARTGVEEVEGFVTMVLQAERFGTALSQSLRVHAQALRTARRQRAEEAAAKIALKLLFPLIFCIFPALLVVLLGPAMIQIHRVLLPTLGGG
jgi:tight adherence protein C